MLLRTFAVAAAFGSLGLVPWQAASASAVSGPRISARPSSAMVNQTIRLSGTGFGAHRNIQLMECSAKSWIVPQQVCTAGNSRVVRTNALGGFAASFTVRVCNAPPSTSGPVTERRCYIGEPAPYGVDTERLMGAVEVTVSYP
jgi:hypothetical protein